MFLAVGGLMRILCKMMIILAVFAIGVAQATDISRTASIRGSFESGSLSMSKMLDKNLQVKQGSDDIRGDIYEFNTKSPLKAFLFSLAIPGGGQFYNDSKIKAGSFFVADIALWSGYLLYHGKGADKEKGYKVYADQHYLSSVFLNWWDAKDTSYQNDFSHRLPLDGQGNPIHNREYYENIGKYDQFQVGWDDIGVNIEPPPPGSDQPGYVSPHRKEYLNMRKKSNDYFSKASTMAMISMGNHLISAFEAAIAAKKYNRGSKQYSLDMRTKNIDGNIAPFFVVTAKF